MDKDYNYNPWSDQYKIDEYEWWLTFHRNDHYAFPGPSLGYYSDRAQWRQNGYKLGAFEDEHCDDDRYYDRDCYWDDSYFDWN